MRWLLSHRAGLIGPREVMPPGALYDWDTVCAVLAATPPWWEPGTAQGYHGMTFGFLVGEVVRRITGMSLGAFLRAEIAEPLGADVFVGVPVAEHPRCAEMIGQLDEEQIMRMLPGVPVGRIRELSDHPFAATAVALAHILPGDANSSEWRSAEVPSGNGHVTARGLATVYGALTTGRAVRPDTLEAIRTLQGAPGEPDLVLPGPHPGWGLGFSLNALGAFGPDPRAFGYGGAGGSLAFADPEHRVSYAYVTNMYISGVSGKDTRSPSLVRALYSALEALR